MEFNAIINGLLAKRTKLDPQTIKMQGLSKEEVAEYNARRKALVAQDKLDAFKTNNCTIEYKGKVLEFNPVSTTTDAGLHLVIWKNATANGYLVCYANKEGKCELRLMARVIETNKFVEYKRELLKKEQSFIMGLFGTVIEGLDFETFSRMVTMYKKWKEVTCPRCLRDYKQFGKKN